MCVIRLENKITNDEFVQFVYDKLDIKPSEFKVTEIPFNLSDINSFDWNIGLVCGNSGSGKTTILKHLGNTKPIEYDFDKCVVSQFGKYGLTPEQASDLLFNVGLSSIPTWLNKPNQLSNGEKARLDIAMQIASAKDNEVILVDEWTSVVNRDVAKAMSNSIQKFIRRKNLKFIFFSCHFDIIEWLQCDWIYNLNKLPCELEKLIYSDNKEYEVYKRVNNNIVLSEEITL